MDFLGLSSQYLPNFARLDPGTLIGIFNVSTIVTGR
jgi:hypothetical protein